MRVMAQMAMVMNLDSAPIGYVTRPYVVYRSHGTRPRPSRPGWEGPPTLPTRSSYRSRR